MAVKLADAVVYIGSDSEGLKRGLGDAEQRSRGWGGLMTGVMAGIGVGIAQAVGGALSSAMDTIGSAITSASDLQETTSKIGVLFGDSSEAITAWAGTAATAFGQSQQQALDAAANFAIFGKAAGLSGDDLVGFSTKFTELASDLASFNNTTPEQAINAIGAALRGESEPLRQYGVLLDDASLRAEAFRQGLTTSNSEALNAQQRILAAQGLIFQQTQVQQGDFERTAGGLANQQRTLAAQWDDFKAALGSAFLPAVQGAVTMLNDFAQEVLPKVVAVIQNTVIPAINGVMQSVSDFIAGWGGAKDDAKSYADDLGAFFRQVATDAGQMSSDMLAEFMAMSEWFGSGTAQSPFEWLASLGATIAATAMFFAEQGAKITASLLNIAETIEAMKNLDFARMRELAQAGTQMQFTPFQDLSEWADNYEKYRERLMGMFANEQAAAGQGVGYTPFIEPTYQQFLPSIMNQSQQQLYMPIIINNGSGNAQGVAAAAQQGVLQALRSAGLA